MLTCSSFFTINKSFFPPFSFHQGVLFASNTILKNKSKENSAALWVPADIFYLSVGLRWQIRSEKQILMIFSNLITLSFGGGNVYVYIYSCNDNREKIFCFEYSVKNWNKYIREISWYKSLISIISLRINFSPGRVGWELSNELIWLQLVTQ